MNQKIAFVVLTFLILAFGMASFANAQGVYAKVVHSTKRDISKRGKTYVRYTLRLRTEDGKLITGIAVALKDSSFESNMTAILHDTRYGMFTIYQRGNRNIVSFATPSERRGARISQEKSQEKYLYQDMTTNSRIESDNIMEKSITIGNSEISIGSAELYE